MKRRKFQPQITDSFIPKIDKTQNTVNVLFPYRTKYGVWCFDDEQLGIVGEPFVGDINTMIDIHAQGSENLIINISSQPIPGSTLSLTKREDLGQGFYQLDGTEITGWLCPCFLNYFPDYVEKVYAKITLPKEQILN